MYNKKKYCNRYLWYILLLYSAVFLLCTAVIFSPFFVEKRSFVWKMDGWTQHLKALTFYSNWLQEIVRTLFSEGKLVIPQWSECIGYGSDIISTLHYYVVGDPLALFSVFIPDRYMVEFYDFMLIMRIYLAGISFFIYCLYREQKETIPVVIGALIYCFCGYALIYGLHHPYFINPMIYLPLILTGVEIILKTKKPLFFMLMILISVVSNFYFFYMLAIFTGLYVLFRVFGDKKSGSLKKKAILILQFVKYGLVGTLSGSFMLAPVLCLFFEGNRIEAGYHFSFWYGSAFYHKLPSSFISLVAAGNQTALGYALITIPAIIWIFFQRKKYFTLKAGWILLTLFLMLPKAGEIMHGFSYPSNRWCFGYSMLVAYMVVVAFESSRERRRNVEIQLLCGIMVVINLCWNGFYYFSAQGKQVVLAYNTLEEAKNIRQVSVDKLIETCAQEENEKDFYRYSGRFSVLERNSTLLSGLASTSYYWSLADGKIDDYFREMETRISSDFNYRELDSRFALNELASVRYFVTPAGSTEEIGIPFGYRKIILKEKNSDEKYKVYRNSNPLPLGYTYDGWIPKEKYQSMTAIEKQNALLQGVVSDQEKKIASTYPEAAIHQDAESIPYHLQCGSGVRKNGDHFTVTQKGAEIVLTFSGKEKAETYLHFKRLFLKEKDVVNRQIPVKGNAIVLKIIARTEKGTEIKKKLPYLTENHIRYNNRHDFLVHFGYGEEKKVSLTIRFPREGDYYMEEPEIICQPVQYFEKYVNKRKEAVLENVIWSPNKISGEISLNKKKILCLSIPYSRGWEARVDEKTSRIMKVNTMFMAIPLEEGTHRIELRYHTPGSRIGSIISLIGLCFMIILSKNKLRAGR